MVGGLDVVGPELRKYLVISIEASVEEVCYARVCPTVRAISRLAVVHDV